jgi:hypothetical protein
MKKQILLIGLGMAAIAAAQEVDLDFLKPLASKAAESTVVDLGPEQLGMLKGLGADAAGIPEVAGLRRVQVRSFEFDKPGLYNMAELDAFRDKVKGTGSWSSIISVKERKGEFTEILMHRPAGGGDADGMLIIAAEEDEVTVVNIVGRIDLKNLGKIAGTMGIPGLGSSKSSKDGKADPKPEKKEDQDNL